MPFLHLSDLSMEGIRVDRQYSGANHGKSRNDGEGAVLKTMASNAVKGGRTVIDITISNNRKKRKCNASGEDNLPADPSRN